MDDKEDVNPFSRRVLTGVPGSQAFDEGLSNTPQFTLMSNTAPNVNPFANPPQPFTNEQQPSKKPLIFQASADAVNSDLFNSSAKPAFSRFLGISQPIPSSTGFLASQVTTEMPNQFTVNISSNQKIQEATTFGGITSKNLFKRSTTGDDSAASSAQIEQDTDVSKIDPETGGPLVTSSVAKELFTGRKIDLKRQPASRSGKTEASVRPRSRRDVPSTKRRHIGEFDTFEQTKLESRKLAKSDNTFGDPASVDISELEKFGAGRQSKSRDSSPRKESKSADSSPHKKSEIRRGGIFGAALKATGIGTEKRKDRPALTEQQKVVPRGQITRQVSKSPEDCKKISVRGIPDEFNTKEFLHQHFRQFGRLSSVHPHPAKQGAIISFRHHEDAIKAKSRGKYFKPGAKPVSIFLMERKPTRRPTITDEDGKEVSKPRKGVVKIKPELVSRTNEREVIAEKPAYASEPSISLASEPSKKPAYSATERYQILVENDKLLRQAQGNKKQEELSSASAVVGSCCDMCPEKERYMREVQRRVHVFEMIPGTDKNPQINHSLAVKEYSRSSADQEAPLPHELRPPSILNMTMNYLLTAIMDKGEGRWADWFDFVWNRTRGIRKDITQQHLCNLTAVDLVEKCARFHIYCAHRLCEAGTSAFDPKINNENLTKCLQSLKQFYADLDEEGTICPNEAEFRGYNVLLNLNQGDILREVQKYRFEVRESSQVKFAVQVFTDLNSNNYVRFFKLVKSATYLNACVLHRYFTQVRASALETMVRAYSTARGGSYPLMDFVRQLSFEDESEATEFCAFHGLDVTYGDIIFESKSSFVRPNNAIGATRALKLIESKNKLSIGEVVNNQQPLPTLQPHFPKTSFDSDGKFIGQHKKMTAIPTKTEVVEESTEELEDVKQPEYTHEQVKLAARDIFFEVINEMCDELSSGLLRVLNLMKTQAPVIMEELMQEVMVPLIYDVMTEAYKEEVHRVAMEKKRLQEELERREKQRIEEEKEKARIESLKESIATEVCHEIVNNFTAEEALSVAITENMEVKQQLKKESILRSTFTINLELVEETLKNELERISSEVYQAAIEARRQRLAEIQRCMELIRVGRYFKKWKNMHAARIRLKRAMYEFPSAPATTSIKGQIETLLPFRSSFSKTSILNENTMLVSKKAKMSLKTPVSVVDDRTDIAHSILQHHYLAYHQHQKAWASLELPNILSESLRQAESHSNNIYWKLVVSVPDIDDEELQTSGNAEILCDWIEAKFTRGKISNDFKSNVLMDSDKVDTISLYTSPVHNGYNKHDLSICVKCVHGHLEKSIVEEVERRHQFLGTSAIILVLEMPEDVEDEYYWLSTQLRLKNILQAKPLMPAVPVVVCLLGWTYSACFCCERLSLQKLEQEGLLSAYKIQPILQDILDPKANELLSQSVEWLALHQPKPPSLKQLPLRAFVDHGLMLFFTTSLYDDVKDRRQAGIPDQNPEYIVELYNSVISHLCKVATSSQLTSISWPVAEFSTKNSESIDGAHLDWNSDSQMLRLKSRISSLKLPDPPDTNLLDDWYLACSACLQYVKTITADPRTKAPLINRVKRLLEKRQNEFENTCYLSFSESGCVPTVDHIPWTKILEICISYKLTMLQDAMLYNEDFDADSHLFVVYYLESDLNTYKTPSVWKEAIKETAEDTRFYPESIQKSFYSSANKQRAEISQVEDIDGAVLKPVKVIPTPIAIVTETSETVTQFKLQMMKEKEEMRRLDKLLSECAMDDYTQNQIMMTEYKPNIQLKLPKANTNTNSYGSTRTIEEKLQELRENIQRDRRANQIVDLKIHSFLDH